MSILTAMFNPEVLEIVKNQAVSTTERAAAKNILTRLRKLSDDTNYELQLSNGLVTMSVLLLALGNPSKQKETILRMVLRGAVAELTDNLDNIFMGMDMAQLLNEKDGLLLNVTDENEIIRSVADYYAEKKAEADCWRFNTQKGGNAVAVTIDLKTLPHLKNSKNVTDIVVNAKREDFIQPGLEVEQPAHWLVLERDCWPASRLVADKMEKLSKYAVLDGVRKKVVCGKVKEVNRHELHLRITAKLDETINPTLMANAVDDYDTMPVYPLAADVSVPSVYSLGIMAGDPRFNSQAATGATVTMPEKPEATTSETKQVKVKEEAKPAELKFPIAKEQCKLSNGNYKCPKCGEEGLKKAGLQTYTMKKLPEGVSTDAFEEQVKWSGSALCGPCRDDLKNKQDAELAKYTEYNKAMSEWEKAEDDVATARAKQAELENSIETLKKSGQQPAAILEETLETLRLNTQSAEAKATELMAKVDELDPNKKEQQPQAEEKKEEEPAKEEPKQQPQSATANIKNGATNITTRGKKGKKARR